MLITYNVGCFWKYRITKYSPWNRFCGTFCSAYGDGGSRGSCSVRGVPRASSQCCGITANLARSRGCRGRRSKFRSLSSFVFSFTVRPTKARSVTQNLRWCAVVWHQTKSISKLPSPHHQKVMQQPRTPLSSTVPVRQTKTLHCGYGKTTPTINACSNICTLFWRRKLIGKMVTTAFQNDFLSHKPQEKKARKARNSRHPSQIYSVKYSKCSWWKVAGDHVQKLHHVKAPSFDFGLSCLPSQPCYTSHKREGCHFDK